MESARRAREAEAGAARVAVLKQFRPDFRPQYVLALDAVRTKSGKPTWYRISVPGRPNGRTGWVRAGALELHPVQQARDHLPRSAQVRVLGRRAARPLGQGGRRRAWRGDAARALLRHATSSTRRSTPTGRSSAPTRSRRARTRSSPTGRAAGSSACTERRGRTSSGRRSRTAAFGSTTTTSSSCATASRSGRRSRSSASGERRADGERSRVSVTSRALRDAERRPGAGKVVELVDRFFFLVWVGFFAAPPDERLGERHVRLVVRPEARSRRAPVRHRERTCGRDRTQRHRPCLHRRCRG